MLSFDLGAPVGDVAWAPFSSTVFAAATDGGRVHVFDLAQQRGGAVCVQRVARKARLTRLAFNPRHPVLLVGTEHGEVTCLKLSPNLRRGFNAGALRSLCAPRAASAAAACMRHVHAPTNQREAFCPAACPVGTPDLLAASRLSRTDTQKAGAQAAEAARLEGVLELAAKCNQALQPEDWALV